MDNLSVLVCRTGMQILSRKRSKVSEKKNFVCETIANQRGPISQGSKFASENFSSNRRKSGSPPRSNDPCVEIAHRVALDGAIRSAIQCHPLFVGRANNWQPCGMRFIPQTRRPVALKGCVCLIFRGNPCSSRTIAIFHVRVL